MPYIPGSSLHGVIRAWVEKALRSGQEPLSQEAMQENLAKLSKENRENLLNEAKTEVADFLGIKAKDVDDKPLFEHWRVYEKPHVCNPLSSVDKCEQLPRPDEGQKIDKKVEGEILCEQPRDEFYRDLQQWTAGRQGWVRLLTPMVRPKVGLAGPLDSKQVKEVIMTGFQRYRVWRTGFYFDGDDGFEPVGIDPVYCAEDAPLEAGGVESVAMQAVPERSRFHLRKIEEAARWFIEGTGHPGWSYLGWGQVVIE